MKIVEVGGGIKIQEQYLHKEALALKRKKEIDFFYWKGIFEYKNWAEFLP